MISLLLCCVILSTAIISFVFVRQMTYILQSSATENMVRLCKDNAHVLNTALDGMESSVDMLAHYMTENIPSAEILHDKDSAEYAEYFTKINQVAVNHAHVLEGVVAVYAVFDPAEYDGAGFFYRADEQGALQKLPFSAQNVTQTSNWSQSTAAGVPVWIDHSQATNGTDTARTFSYVVPLYQGETLLGIVGMDFSYTMLQQAIAGIKLLNTGFACVLGHSGSIIAHPTLTENTIVEDRREESGFANVRTQLAKTKRAAFESGSYDIDKAVLGELFPYEMQGEEHQLVMCALQNNMVLCLTAPSSEIFAEQTAVISEAFLALILIVITAILAAVLFSSHLTAPIIALKKAASRFTDGDLNTPVTSSAQDEIGELASSFEKARAQMKNYLDDLYREAHIDSLTGTHNKSAFIDAENAINEKIQAGTAAFSIALFDVNYLKITNDIFGHIVGDELLQTVANCMKNTFGPQNVYRIGGDEFVALLCTDDVQKHVENANACFAQIEGSSLITYPDVPVSSAMGIATFSPESDTSLADVLTRADRMMYKNKTEIKKNTPFWQKDLNAMRQSQIQRYLEFLKTLSESMGSYPFLYDITTNTNWFFNDINKDYPICRDGCPTNTVEEMMAVVHPADREALAADLQKIADGTSLEHNMNYRWINRNGVPVWINCHGKVINDTQGKPFLMIGRVSDTLLRPWYNPRTGLFNKEKFALDFQNGDLVAFRRFVLINVDNLSHINLKHGHAYGDKALSMLANTLVKRFPNNTIYHMEKDYFVLLLNTTKEAKIRQLVEQIQLDVEEMMSVSVAIVPNEKQYHMDASSIYEHARLLLKANKTESGGSVSFFTKEDFANTIFDIELAEELERSVYEEGYNGFHLCYQPQVDAKTHHVVCAEALLRYTSPVKGVVPPVSFIPILERTRLICEVGTWVLKKAIAQCALWREKQPNMTISVNLSPVQLQDEYLADTVITLLDNHGVPASALTLELTESIELEDSPFEKIFAQLRRAGVHISIDDFGTGYANIAYLKKIQADEVKIDRLFVKDLKQGSFNQNLIANLATFAKDNELLLCIEGVETPAELAVLELSEPDLLQGYLFDKPLAAEEFEKRYIPQQESVTWGFEEELKKQREHVQFTYFDVKNILSKVEIGLWTLRYRKTQFSGELYCDDITRNLLSLGADLSPAQCFDYVMSRVHETDMAHVLEMLQMIGDAERVEQFEFLWKHPTNGNIQLRVTGKFTEETSNGMFVFEGLARQLQIRDNADT